MCSGKDWPAVDLQRGARRRSARLGGDTPEREEGEPGCKDLEGRCPGAVRKRGATTPRARAPRGSGKAERIVRPEGRRKAEPARRPGAAPLDPLKRQGVKDSRVNSTSWQLGNRHSNSDSRRGPSSETRNARAADCRSTSRHATPGDCNPLRSTLARPTVPPCNHRVSSPRPTPIRSRAHRAIQTRSPKTNPPATSAHRPSDSHTRRSSLGCSPPYPPTNTASPPPLVPRTPTPTRSTTDIAHPSPSTATPRIPAHPPSSHQ